MRYFLSLLLLFAMPLFSFGQTSVPDFGVFENDEIQLKECEFDRSAEAIILFDKATTTYDDQYNMITDRRIRFKVLKESGIRRADIHLPYYSEDRFQSIGSVEAIVLTEEGGNLKTFTLDKKSVYDRKLNQLYSEVVFALPNVKVGSIIDYRYKITSESYSALREWYFQSDLPVKLSSYNLYMNPTLAFAYSVRKSALYPITIKQDKDLGRTLFEMKDIPGLRDEAYSTAERDFLQRVDFQLSNFTSRSGAAQTTSTTWPEMNKELLQSSYFGSQLNKDISDPALGLSLAAAKSADDKVKLVHGYVKKTMTWDHIDSKYSDEGIKKAWDKKKGNSGDINLILVNLLKQAGLQAYPLLVSEREHGKIDTTYPYLNQFNKIVALVQAEDRDYILDGSDNATPWFMIPPSLLNTKGFIIDKKRSGFYNINDNKRKYGSYIQFLGKVTEPGKMMVDATVKHNEYSRLERAERYLADKEGYKNNFISSYASFKLDSFNVAGIDDETIPLTHTLKGEYGLEKSGNYYLLNYNFFTGLEKNPFIADNRFTNIDFGCKRSTSFMGTFILPANATVESLPKSIGLVNPEKTLLIKRQVQKSENIIQVNYIIEVNQTEFPADEYDVVKDFYKQMFDLLTEPVVVKYN